MTVHATQVAHSGAPRTILRLPKVTHTTGLCRSSIYARIQRGTFPKPIKLGPKAVGWLASEVDTWLGDCIASSRQVVGAEGCQA